MAAAQLTSQGERMFHGELSQKFHEEIHQIEAQRQRMGTTVCYSPMVKM